MSDIQFNPSSYAKGGEQMATAGQDLQTRTQSLLAEVSDLSVLGTNDTLGGVCQMIYGVFLQVFTETAQGAAQSLGWQGQQLTAVGKQYQGMEDDFAAQLQQFGGEI